MYHLYQFKDLLNIIYYRESIPFWVLALRKETKYRTTQEKIILTWNTYVHPLHSSLIWWMYFAINRLKISCPTLVVGWVCGLDSLLWLWLNSWSFSCYFSTQPLKPAEPTKQPSQAVPPNRRHKGGVRRKRHRCLVTLVNTPYYNNFNNFV